MLEQNAVFTHDINLLRRCLSTWNRLAVGSHCEQLKCVLQQMESRTETHRLNLSFSTWSVFSVAEVSSGLEAETGIGSLSFALQTQAYRVCLQAVLCEYNEKRKTVMKRRTFLIWSQTVEYFRGAQHYYQRVVMYRCFSQWLHKFHHHSELLCLSRELEEVCIRRLRWRAFCLWQLKLSRVQTHMQHISSLWKNTRHLRLHLRVWRQRLIRRKRARAAVHRWKQHISQARRQRNITKEMKNWFLHWKEAFRQSVRSRDHYTQTQETKVLLAWHRHTVSAQRLRYREAWFQYSSEMRLQAAVFMQWRTALTWGQQRKRLMECQLIYENRITEQAFHRWKTAAAERRGMKTFNNSLLHKWFNRWKYRKDLLNVADRLCLKTRRHEARLAFSTWSLWAKERKAQRQMREAVSLWLDGRAVSRTFHQWLRVYQQYQKASRHRQMQLSHRALEKGVNGLIYLYWSSWKNQTEASLLHTQRFQRCVLQKSWLTWRKRHIRNRVSADYSHNVNCTLLAKVLHVWWLRAHGSDFEP
ncbi:protein SFI1 homolog [Danio aesculapii]|uniref:protein SFI1 homolog n=1 Tax=Danio aesculapii TaxID=1142201 RepID=UPI0024C00421|nr:protein SFI1 homolog [Danio aesculapii]